MWLFPEFPTGQCPELPSRRVWSWNGYCMGPLWGAQQPCSGRESQWPEALPQRKGVRPSLGVLSGFFQPRATWVHLTSSPHMCCRVVVFSGFLSASGFKVQGQVLKWGPLTCTSGPHDATCLQRLGRKPLTGLGCPAAPQGARGGCALRAASGSCLHSSRPLRLAGCLWVGRQHPRSGCPPFLLSRRS